VCIGSVAELESLSGVKGITDLHRDKIDQITIPSKKGKGVLRRVEEIFDCWFESGRYGAIFLGMQVLVLNVIQYALRPAPLPIRK